MIASGRVMIRTATVQRCNALGTAKTPVKTCKANEDCLQGVCKERKCSKNESKCDGLQGLLRCKDIYKGFEKEACPSEST